jgi:ATP-dependent DNA helicase RecQ
MSDAENQSTRNPGDVDEALRRFFGLAAFRPGQRDALLAVLDGRDCLVILPTGSGKSLVYQLAAALLPGTVIVVSPLIALMRDQALELAERGYAGAAALHSQIPEPEQRQTLSDLRAGRLKLLYVTPERCADDEFRAAAREATISLFAVDEAHCISEWGHDFRPAYLLLAEAVKALGRPPTAAFTATATPWVRDDVIARLDLQSPVVVVRGFDRPNLFFEVYRPAGERNKPAEIAGLLVDGVVEHEEYEPPNAERLAEASAGRGIVYTAFTRTARELSQWLNRCGVLAAYYHGQLRAGQRNAVHERFREGGVRLIAATNAFGMGIDLPDLHFVAHYDPPPSLEAYYQEAGRAGRDGRFARCPLLWREEDLGATAFTSVGGAVTQEDLERVAAALDGAPPLGITQNALAQRTGLRLARVARALEPLVAVRAAAPADANTGRYRLVDGSETSLRRALEREGRRVAHDRTRLAMVRTYARLDSCRRQFLLQYFGQYDAPGSCGMCDRCAPRRGERAQPAGVPPVPEDAPLAGETVWHQAWGRGVVQHVSADRVTVHFDSGGYRTLDLQGALRRGVLRTPATNETEHESEA